MRISVLAAIAAAALVPGLAAAAVHDGAKAPHVRVHKSGAAHAGTTWHAPTGATGTREAYRRNAPLYGEDDYPVAPYDDADYGDAPYGYGDTDAYGVEDHAMSDRFVRDDRGVLDYDRDYPYDAPYGNYGPSYRNGMGGGYYTIVETTTTTGPSVVHYAEKKVAVHRAKRTVKKRRAYRTSSRASAGKTCYCK